MRLMSHTQHTRPHRIFSASLTTKAHLIDTLLDAMAETHTVSGLLVVPNEVLYHIAGYLPRCDAISLQRTCHAFHLPLRSLLVSNHKDDILIFAAQKDYLDLLITALAAGADLTYPCRRLRGCSHIGGAALHHAARAGHTAIITELLRHNPPLESEDAVGWTALYCAAWNGHQAAVDLLLAAGCNPNCGGKEETSLLSAAIVGNLIPTATAFITQMGEDEFLQAAHHERLEILTLMLARGITATVSLPLHMVANSSTSIVKVCLEHGGPHSQAHMLEALSVAVTRGKFDTAEYLLTQGADPNFGRRKHRPIMTVAHQGDTEMARLLLAHGADLRELMTPHADVLLSACLGSPPELVALLLDADQGLSVDGSGNDKRKQGPLHVAAQWGNVGVIRLLIERGADVDARRGPKGETPLQWAARAAHRSAVEALLEGGADTQLLCNDVTALLMANRSSASLERRGMTMAALVKGGARISELGRKSTLMVNRILAEEKAKEQASESKEIVVL